MDIRNFFQKGISSVKRKKNRESSSGSDSDNTHLPKSSAPAAPSTLSIEIDSNDGCHINDVGRYVGRAHLLSAEKKKSILLRPWVPEANYDFRNDAQSLQRKFNYAWLDQYGAYYIVYSKCLKGALCKYCVLFPPASGTVRGVLGSFMIRPFLKFKNVHEDCKKHATTSLHLTATAAAKAFTENVPIDVQLQNSHEKQIEDNRNIISSIISCVIFCGTHDMPLRGKEQDEGVLLDLINMRIESGDTVLKSHLEKGRRNAIYTSPQIQNELIKIGGEVIKCHIISDVKKAHAFSVLADETADIAGKEQLSIGLRFYDKTMGIIREEFVGFIELTSQDASTIAAEIDKFLINNELTPEYCVGFGFDGCSTMAGKEGGVQAILRKKYTRAQYFHCSSHKLNLVVNDVNLVPEIRNTISTTKDVINFFRESTTRRNYAPNISRLCETRWSEKYKAIRKFSQNFTDIAKALDKLSIEGNSSTRKSAYQLYSAVTRPVFIVALMTIAKYSALLEPTANILQAKSIDFIAVGQHIESILDVLKNDRINADGITEELIGKSRMITTDLGVEMSLPRFSEKQKNRSNPPAANGNEYWRRSLIIPYLDSLTTSLQVRFSNENTPAFALSRLHPLHMLKYSSEEVHNNSKHFQKLYGLDIGGELILWYNLWKKRNLCEQDLKNIEVIDLFKDTNEFLPSITKYIYILSALPCTTATVERSFSTLRRVKTWLRSTIGEERLSGLCLMSVHRKFVNDNRKMIEKEIVEKFAENPRRLLLL